MVGGVFKSIHLLLDRVILREQKESLSFSFFIQLLSAVMMLPLLFWKVKLPKESVAYLILFVVGMVDTLATFLIKESIRLLEISLRTIIYQIRIFSVLILSFFLLNEGLGLAKVMGSVLIFLGIAAAFFKRRKAGWLKKAVGRVFERKEKRARGIFFTLTAAVVTAFELMGWKYLLGKFSLPLTLFAVSTISAVVFLFLVPNLTEKVTNLVKGKKGRLVVLNGILANICWFLFFWATSLTEASKTLPITQGFMALTVLGGIVFLKERERIWQKVLGGILAAVGVILVKGA